jgi:hypothetical protein
MPTVILGSALDVVTRCGVPRFLFTDFPLGNPCGRPWDVPMQRAIAAEALALFEGASAPRTVVRAPFRWAEGAQDETWRRRYLEIDAGKREELRLAGERRRASQRRARETGRARSD